MDPKHLPDGHPDAPGLSAEACRLLDYECDDALECLAAIVDYESPTVRVLDLLCEAMESIQRIQNVVNPEPAKTVRVTGQDLCDTADQICRLADGLKTRYVQLHGGAE